LRSLAVLIPDMSVPFLRRGDTNLSWNRARIVPVSPAIPNASR
jgi:hypothetical protein